MMIRTPFNDFEFSGETSFPTTEGGVLKIGESYETAGQIELGIHHIDESDDLPSDILYTRFRLPDHEGIIWESESRFNSDVLVEKMTDLSFPSHLIPYTHAGGEASAVFEGDNVLRGVRYSSDDRDSRFVVAGDKNGGAIFIL